MYEINKALEKEKLNAPSSKELIPKEYYEFLSLI